MNPKVLVAMAVLLASALPPTTRAGSLTTEVIGMFPRDAGEFAYADLRQARYLSWFPELQKQVLPDELRQFEQLLASPGMEPGSQVEVVAWETLSAASGPQAEQNSAVPTSEEVITVAIGQFSPESTEAYFKAKKRTAVKVRDFTLYGLSNGSGAGSLFFCYMDSTTAVLGNRNELGKFIAVHYGEEQSLLGNTQLAPLISQANGRSIVWAVLNAAHTWLTMQQFIPQVAEFPQSQQLFSSLHALTLEVDAGSGVQSRFEAVCASPDDANAFATLLQADLLYRTSRSGGSNQDATGLLDRAKVTSSGDRLDVNMSLADDEVLGLFARSSIGIHH